MLVLANTLYCCKELAKVSPLAGWISNSCICSWRFVYNIPSQSHRLYSFLISAKPPSMWHRACLIFNPVMLFSHESPQKVSNHKLVFSLTPAVISMDCYMIISPEWCLSKTQSSVDITESGPWFHPRLLKMFNCFGSPVTANTKYMDLPKSFRLQGTYLPCVMWNTHILTKIKNIMHESVLLMTWLSWRFDTFTVIFSLCSCVICILPAASNLILMLSFNSSIIPFTCDDLLTGCKFCIYAKSAPGSKFEHVNAIVHIYM